MVPTQGSLAEPQIRAMFDRIAGVYDRMNSVMTVGLDARWRARAVDLAGIDPARPGGRVLDVACGTGDLALEAHRRGAEVVGLDFSGEMLARARAKEPGMEWVRGNALALPFEDASFTAVTVGFGARNFSDLAAGVGEMARVVRPGGRVVVLEITKPEAPLLSGFFSLWFDRIVPLLGRAAGDPDAYAYLPSSVKRFPGPEGLARVMAGAGLEQISWTLTAGGIIALHVGLKA